MNQVKFKGQPVRLSGQSPRQGDKIPSFTLVDQDLKERHLDEFRGKKKIISIVPSLDTGVCLTSTKKLNDFAKKHPDCHIIIISADLPFAQKRICGLEHLDNVTTLSMMRDKELGKAMGLLIDEGPLKGLLSRALFVVDGDNRILYSEIVDEITHEPHYEGAFNAL